MDKRKRRLLCMLEGSGRKSRWISGAPPLSFKAFAAGELENYRIYGNTVGGESVGDRTGNLFDEIYEKDGTLHYVPVAVGDGFFTLSTTTPNGGTSASSPAANIFFLAGNVSSGASTANNGVWREKSRTIEAVDGYVTIAYRAVQSYGEQCYPWNNDTMLNAGSTALPYEPYGYKVPVTVSNGTDTLTTPIYLPEQIKMVGEEAEYVNYAEQKLHRVRKNLLPNTATSQTINGVTFTVNGDGSVTCNGTATGTAYLVLKNLPDFNGTCFLTGCPSNGSTQTYTIQYSNMSDGAYSDVGTGVRIAKYNNTDYPNARVHIKITSGYTCDNLTFYPMIRKADIEDDTYEPYIENVDLDVTLPAISTLTGTNVLSVGTAVQPSNIEIKGKIKAL